LGEKVWERVRKLKVEGFFFFFFLYDILILGKTTYENLMGFSFNLFFDYLFRVTSLKPNRGQDHVKKKKKKQGTRMFKSSIFGFRDMGALKLQKNS
jgi:hypothetical protein